MFASTLGKIALLVLAVVLAILISKRRGLSIREIGMRRCTRAQFLAWIGIWVVWVAVTEVMIKRLGLEQAQPWPDYDLPILALRILAIGLVGPFAEEFIVRGVLFARLRNTALGPFGAILVTAAGWAAVHYHYSVGGIAVVLLDGIVLGLARHRSGSLWPPIVMHAMGNLFSIGQSLFLR